MRPLEIRAFASFLSGRRVIWAIAACLIAASTGLAQFPGGQGDGDSRGDGRGGDGRGGSGRGSGGFNPEDYLKRMDSNGNGILEPSEIPEDRRARMFLEWTAREGGIDLTQPVPIEKFQESMQAARERMGRGGMGRPGGGDSGRGDRSRGGDSDRGGPGGNSSGDRPSDASRSATNKPVPQIAGFGAPSTAAQPRGFGSATTTTTGGAAPVSASLIGAATAAAPSGGAAGGPNPRAYAESSIRQRDKDGNGVLERDKGEMNELGSTLRDADSNNDGKITFDEVMAKLGVYSAQRGSDASSATTTVSASPATVAPAVSASSANGRKSYRAKTAKERLPSDIPSWFARSDEDGDGQVLMSEYATTWTDAKVSEFAKYDLNRDGVITARECLKAERK